jgi:hypothetical protein
MISNDFEQFDINSKAMIWKTSSPVKHATMVLPVPSAWVSAPAAVRRMWLPKTPLSFLFFGPNVMPPPSHLDVA